MEPNSTLRCTKAKKLHPEGKMTSSDLENLSLPLACTASKFQILSCHQKKEANVLMVLLADAPGSGPPPVDNSHITDANIYSVFLQHTLSIFSTKKKYQ